MHDYEFSIDPEPQPDCGRIISRWKSLVAEGGAICAYAAYLQDFDPAALDLPAKDGSVWIISQLKTAEGRWTYQDEENWSKDSLDWPDDSDDGTPEH